MQTPHPQSWGGDSNPVLPGAATMLTTVPPPQDKDSKSYYYDCTNSQRVPKTVLTKVYTEVPRFHPPLKSHLDLGRRCLCGGLSLHRNAEAEGSRAGFDAPWAAC